MPESETRLLIAYPRPEEFTGLLDARFPDLEYRCLTDPDSVETVLGDFDPTVAFGIGVTGMPKEVLKTVLDWPGLRWFANGGAGVEHLTPWDPADRHVTNMAGVLTPYLAEYVISALQMANVGFPTYFHRQLRREWKHDYWLPLEGRRLCVLGLGHVGREVARRAAMLGMEVVGTRANPQPCENVARVFAADEAAKAVEGADFVAVHTALTEESRGLVNAAVFDAMTPGVIFLNAARGPVVDTPALLSALDGGRVATAILDVFDEEPLPQSSPLWVHERVVITPHMADGVADWPRRMAKAFTDNLENWLAGRPLDNVVDPSRGY